MLKFHNFDIVFQEIPGETTLAFNITGCPVCSEGCHSTQLWEDTGEPLTREALLAVYERYSSGVTCIALMCGDADPAEVGRIAHFIRNEIHLKSAWYSGRSNISPKVDRADFDFIKVGPYIEKLGGLKSPATNQRLYLVSLLLICTSSVTNFDTEKGVFQYRLEKYWRLPHRAVVLLWQLFQIVLGFTPS